MLLREFFNEYTKEDLIAIAKTLDIKRYSRLRKARIVDEIVDCLCSEETARKRLACLTDEELAIFRRGCEGPCKIGENEVVDSIQLYNYWLGYFDEKTDDFCVYEEMTTTFSKIDDEDFRCDQKKKGWLMKCIQFFSNYYGIGPIEKLYEMYALKEKDEFTYMLQMLYEMPIDIVGCATLAMVALGINDFPKEDPLYSDFGIFVHIPYMEDDEFDYLLKQQIGKDFYVPSVLQVEELSAYGYEKSSLAYKKLEKFFTNKLKMSAKHARMWCLRVWVNSYENENPTDIIEMLNEDDIVFDSEKQIKDFVDLLMTAHNNTRLITNRGHKPNEIRKKEFDNGIDGKMVQSKRKIYPNAPCICGSGKKFKKCCAGKIS